MAINPNIALQVQRPEFPDPLAQYAKIAQVRNMLTQGQLHQQQILNEQEALKTHQLANAETERAQQDNANYQQAWRAAGGDLKKARELALASGVRSGYITKLDDEINKQAEQLAKTDKEKTAAAQAKLDYLHETLTPLASETDPNRQMELYNAKLGDALRAGVITQDEAQPYSGPGQVSDLLARVTTQKHLLAAAEEKRKQAEEGRKETLFPSQQVEAEQKAIVATQEAMGAKKLQPKDVAEMDIQKARNAQITANEEAMRKQGQQRIGIEAARNAREQQIYEQTYGAGSNEALRGVEPKSRQPALREAQKAADEYNKAVTAATDMQSFLDLARSGNKAAGSNLPLVGVSTINALNGIKRINQAEIAQYEGAGSLLDRVQGKIGKLVVGQPIPADVLSDIESLHKVLSGNASEAYNRKLGSINQNYKSSFKPVGNTPTAAPAATHRFNPATGKIEAIK